jgi:hypothetical protein
MAPLGVPIDRQHQGITLKADIKRLKDENKALIKEVDRKNRALAETAALLVLQKKYRRYGETTWRTHSEYRTRQPDTVGQRSAG